MNRFQVLALTAGLAASGVGLLVVASPVAASGAVATLLLVTLLASASTRPLALGLLGTYAVAVFAGGRDFTLLGWHPIYIADILLLLASGVGALSARATGPSRVRWFALAAISLAGLAAIGVYRGIAVGNENALKGAILGLYPLAALGVCRTLLSGPLNGLRVHTAVLLAPSLGTALTLLGVLAVPPALAGLGLAVAVSYGVARWSLRSARFVVGVSTIAGVGLALVEAKRGPILALLAAALITWLATNGLSASKLALGLLAVVVLVGSAIAFASAEQRPDEYAEPGLFSRFADSFAGRGNEAGNNVEVRLERWAFALGEASSSPLLGVGTGAPMPTEFRNFTVSADKAASGPHNSFIGYAYYLGYPAALLVIFVFARAGWSCWRASRRHWAPAAAVGSLSAALVTVLTNDTLETTYLAGIAWLTVAYAIAAASLAVVGSESPMRVSGRPSPSLAPNVPENERDETRVPEEVAQEHPSGFL